MARNIAILVTLVILLTASFPALAEQAKSSLKKAAVVNGVVISQKELAKQIELNLQRFSQQDVDLSKKEIVKLKNEILESLIDREILYQESQKSGIKVDKKNVDKNLSAVKKRFPSKDEYKRALKTMETSEKDVKMQIKKELAIDKLIDTKIAKTIVVSDKEAKAFYDNNTDLFEQPEEVRTSHILIKIEPNASAQKKAKAYKKIKDIQKKLKDGQDFAVLAKEYSEDEASSANGGSLGYIELGQTVKPFEDAAFGIKPNEVSDIVKTQFGYHLIKVYDKKPEEILPYGDVKNLISKDIKQEKIKEETIKYVAELKKYAKIEKYL